MATAEQTPHLAPHVTDLLARLRRRIRGYLWGRGLALTATTAGLLFWVLLGIDWTFEPSREVRLGMLAVAALVVAYVFYRLVVSRAFVPLPDRSMAVLVERYHGRFSEELLTAVELTEQTDDWAPYTREMLAHTCDEAADRAHDVNLGVVFNLFPLVVAGLLLLFVAVSILGFGLDQPAALEFGLRRLATMTDDLWPRYTRLAIEGFPEGEAVIAKGSDLQLVVNADTTMAVPDNVQIRYRGEDGQRQRKNMVREGNAVPGRDAWQTYRYVFQGVLTPLEFEVRGGDARLRGLRIRVVDSPTIVTSLHCEYPSYMGLPPRDVPVTAAVSLPRGTQVTIRCEANKDLREARADFTLADNKASSRSVKLGGAGAEARRFEIDLPPLEADNTVSFSLLDADNIRNRDPVRISLVAVPDTAPQVNVRLAGIGSAITVKARLPLVGDITDDYGVARAWLEHRIGETAPGQKPFASSKPSVALTVNEAFEVAELKLTPGQKLVVSAMAADNHSLPGREQPNIGRGEQFLLDVVTPEDLRAILESRELNLRQRFETIIAEVIETRNLLTEKDQSDPMEAAEAAAAKQLERTQLRVERASQNSQKNAQETEGVAASFDGIIAELSNNRIDAKGRESDLEKDIATPLHEIAGQMFPEFDRRLSVLGKALPGPAAGQAAARASAVAQADALVVRMQQTRDKMLELETFNEALDLLRAIISSQHSLGEETKKVRSEKVKSLLQE